MPYLITRTYYAFAELFDDIQNPNRKQYNDVFLGGMRRLSLQKMSDIPNR